VAPGKKREGRDLMKKKKETKKNRKRKKKKTKKYKKDSLSFLLSLRNSQKPTHTNK
jgi:hypothetical protein